MPGSVCNPMVVKIVILFLVAMGVMAMFGKLRYLIKEPTVGISYRQTVLPF